MIKLLLIEDEKNLAEMIAFYLEEEGYITESVQDPADTIQHFRHFKPDLIVTDLMMPGLSGHDIIATIRSCSDIPILMISANTMLNERLQALDSGADDFLCKPFSLKELDSRLKALLRRSMPSSLIKAQHSQPNPEQASVQPYLQISLDSRTVFVKGQEIEVTHIEFELLRLFSRNPGRVFTRNELIDRIKGEDQAILDRTIDVHISSLRRKTEQEPKNPLHIKTVWGTGYKYIE
ncbi:response regulator transcription factor [Paenibacillus sp. JX-17]|uniref:Response regulator transcription factor n=1 Tax=Paenibacillus lacisoli TaxID=3064525 RepID=A0ABT9CFD2_9BACL|nr:response regulator transcription factor [Paenibacillus sp. JX-17]MDO7907283.1 response regulator transcription factor [Paenibacillus sp. JX-17]